MAVISRFSVEYMFINWYVNRVRFFHWHGYVFLYSNRHRLFHRHRYNLLHRIRHLLFHWNRNCPHDRYGDRLSDRYMNRVGLRNRYSYRMRHWNCHGLCHRDTCFVFIRDNNSDFKFSQILWKELILDA